MNKAFGFCELFTERLALRKLKAGDAYVLFALRTNNEVNLYLDRPETTDISQVFDFINKIHISVDSGESFYWAITLPGDDKLIGTICFWNLSDDKTEAEIGYELNPNFQGKGLMQEAISKVIAFGFNDLGFKTITAFPHKKNERSLKLLERNNFKIDTELTDKNKNNEEFDNLLCYSFFNNSNK
ncbi:MAG: N-acetyltransferase [Mucilaginibacter sp.]|nr:N-acetyltransferase [Mucilaginibacter sp.]